MNPWGVLVMLVGGALFWIGFRGTQGQTYALITGHDYVSGQSALAGGAIGKAAADAAGISRNQQSGQPVSPSSPSPSAAPSTHPPTTTAATPVGTFV